MALYRSLAEVPVIPVPLPIPLTDILASKVCPVVYGFDVFGSVPVIGLVQSTCAVPTKEIHEMITIINGLIMQSF